MRTSVRSGSENLEDESTCETLVEAALLEPFKGKIDSCLLA